MDLSLKHYPLRDYRSMWNEMNSIVRDYDKLGKRNKHAIEHAKLSKHMMHLVRLYLMAFDILEKGEIHTYRKQDLPFLMEPATENFSMKTSSRPKNFPNFWMNFRNGRITQKKTPICRRFRMRNRSMISWPVCMNGLCGERCDRAGGFALTPGTRPLNFLLMTFLCFLMQRL